jgi:hypothetical protein
VSKALVLSARSYLHGKGFISKSLDLLQSLLPPGDTMPLSLHSSTPDTSRGVSVASADLLMSPCPVKLTPGCGKHQTYLHHAAASLPSGLANARECCSTHDLPQHRTITSRSFCYGCQSEVVKPRTQFPRPQPPRQGAYPPPHSYSTALPPPPPP